MKKIYAILFLCCALVASAQTYHIGDLYTAPDGSQGIVYYLHPDGSGGWVVALNDACTGSKWGDVTDVPDLANQNPTYTQQLLYDTAGYTNTQVLRNYQNNSTTYAAGVVDFDHGWVLPSPAQLSMLHGRLPFITSAIVGAGGTAMEYKFYWSSAEKDASNAWMMLFGIDTESGYFNHASKNGSCNVRAVRSFSYEVPQPECSYLWSTGDTTPDITVTPDETSIYTVTVTTSGGCADTVEHTIVMRETSYSEFTVSSDTPYTWNGVTYYQSGDYPQTFVNALGCDSVVTLHLTTTFDLPLPDNVFDVDCAVSPDSNAFTMTELFKCPNVNSMSTPMVADMDGDGLPEIIACCYTGSAYFNTGFHVVNGQTGELKYTLNTVQYCNSGLMATIADVDHDGKSELFLLGRDQRLYCYNYNGGVRWSSANTVANNYLLSAADVNNDGVAEIVCGEYVYDAQTGVLLLQGSMVETGMGFGAPHGVHLPNFHIPYYMYALGDVDGDGTLELCAGNAIYKMVITNNAGTAGNSWSILRQADTPASIENKDGQTFLVDFDNDGDFDVCVIGITHSLTQSTNLHTLDVYVWDGQTSQLIAHSPLTIHNKSGASIPYSGDLDGDGYPEIIFAADPGMMAYTYDPISSSMSVMHSYAPFGETAGFTVFDFNQDGRNEIVYRGTTQLYIADGVTLANLCPPVTAYSGTITEYPIVADVNADGHAEIIVARAYNDWNEGGGANGWVSVYGSQIPGAWSSARKVWNQWAYSSVNINEDMTVPQYRFNVATLFSNGEKPFNGFLRQMPYIDSQGNVFNSVADVALSETNAVAQGDSVVFSLTYCNIGDNTLFAPYPVTVLANTLGSETLCTVVMEDNLLVDSCVQQVITLTKNMLCGSQDLEDLVLVVNGSGTGIAQYGGQQPECDISNNLFSFPYTMQHVEPVHLTDTACGDYEWKGQTYTESGDYVIHYPQPVGCDSVEILHLTIFPKPETIISASSDVVCGGDEVILQAQLVDVETFMPVMIAVGDILCSDGSIVKPSAWPVDGKTAMGIVYYVDNTGEHGWAVHLHNQGTSLRWSTSGLDIPALTNYYNQVRNAIMDVDGYFNTQEIRASGNAEMFPVAYAVDFENGWYVPALGQFRLLLAEVVTINNSLQIVDGTPFDMNTNWGYWSSTEGDGGGAWNMYHYGGMFPTSKTVLHRVRSIRNF